MDIEAIVFDVYGTLIEISTPRRPFRQALSGRCFIGQSMRCARSRPQSLFQPASRLRHTAEESKGTNMAIEESFGVCGRVGLDEAAIGMRQIHAKVMEAHLLAGNKAVGFAEIFISVKPMAEARRFNLHETLRLISAYEFSASAFA